MAEHTASRKNPPAEALAQAGRDSKRAYEHDWHIWTEDEINAHGEQWGVANVVARACLNFQQLESAAGRDISLENLGDLAKWIDGWAVKCWRDGEMAERERYQEQGE